MQTLIPKIVTKEVLSQMVDPSISKTNAVLFGPTYRAEEIHDEIERFGKFTFCLAIKFVLFNVADG